VNISQYARMANAISYAMPAFRSIISINIGNGAHSEGVLTARLSLSTGEIARLIDAGVVGVAR
jgi:hypothetical protein